MARVRLRMVHQIKEGKAVKIIKYNLFARVNCGTEEEPTERQAIRDEINRLEREC